MKAKETYGLLGEAALVKEVKDWSELQAGTLRCHAKYLTRLWRKTPTRSKPIVCSTASHQNIFMYVYFCCEGTLFITSSCSIRSEVVQSLKDILNVKYGDAASALAPSDPAGAAPEDGNDGEGLEEDTPAEAGGPEAGDPAEDTNEGEAPEASAPPPVNPADPSQLDTLVMEETTWPPRPWIPKTSLRRWSRSRSMYMEDWLKGFLLRVKSFKKLLISQEPDICMENHRAAEETMEAFPVDSLSFNFYCDTFDPLIV